MLVFAYDSRPETPDYVIPFIRNTTKYCDLHVLTEDKDLATSATIDLGPYKDRLRTIDPASLPSYQHAKKLFDGLYVNYSTNPDSFERPCFHRWLAINAATTTLRDNDYICLLDTDFLIGMSPSELLSQCMARARNHEPQLVVDWQYVSSGGGQIPMELIPYINLERNYPKAIPPHITIMTKAFLHDFCKYILTVYFSSAMKDQLVAQYFEEIGHGRDGGVSDMTALATYSMLNHYDRTFNLKNLKSFQIIGNFYSFLYSEIGQTDDWKIIFQSAGQAFHHASQSSQLIGVHFQGSAKAYMPLAIGADGVDGVLSRAICEEHQRILAEREAKRAHMATLAMANADRPLVFRGVYKLKRGIRQLKKES